MWINQLLRSFRDAGRGVARAVRQERNLRIHLVAVCYVVAAGFLADLDAGRWCAVLLCFGAVLSAELVNTALEYLCDALHPEVHPKIGAAKDAAAGAVLVLAIMSVLVAAAVFGPWVCRGGFQTAATTRVWVVPGLITSLPCAILWIRGSRKWKLKNQV